MISKREKIKEVRLVGNCFANTFFLLLLLGLL